MITLSGSSSCSNSIFTLLMGIVCNQKSAWVKKTDPARVGTGWWYAEKLVWFALILTPVYPQPWTPGSIPPKWMVIWTRCGAEGSLWGSGWPWRNKMLGRKVCHLFSGQNYQCFKRLLKNVKKRLLFLVASIQNTSKHPQKQKWITQNFKQCWSCKTALCFSCLDMEGAICCK